MNSSTCAANIHSISQTQHSTSRQNPVHIGHHRSTTAKMSTPRTSSTSPSSKPTKKTSNPSPPAAQPANSSRSSPPSPHPDDSNLLLLLTHSLRHQNPQRRHPPRIRARSRLDLRIRRPPRHLRPIRQVDPKCLPLGASNTAIAAPPPARTGHQGLPLLIPLQERPPLPQALAALHPPLLRRPARDLRLPRSAQHRRGAGIVLRGVCDVARGCRTMEPGGGGVQAGDRARGTADGAADAEVRAISETV